MHVRVVSVVWLPDPSLREFYPKTRDGGISLRFPGLSRNFREGWYAVYTDEDRARIGRFAAENSNASTLKHFRSDSPDLSKSTVRGFKSKYLAATKKMQTGDIVTAIPSRKRGRPLTLGELDGAVQDYIRALRKAGTPVSTEVILAAAEGIVVARDRTLLQVYTWWKHSAHSLSLMK